MQFWDISRKVGAATTQAIVVLLVINVMLGTFSAYQQSLELYRNEKTRSEDERKKAAEEIAARCNVILDPTETFRGCVAREIEAYEKQANTDNDLKAQQDMAFWAQAVFWLTSLGTLISAVGLAFVWQSLKQTRQAILTDREVGHAQVRAYVAIDAQTPVVRPDVVPEHTFKIRNTGQSPAYSVAYISGFQILPHPLPSTTGHIGGLAPGQDMPRAALAAGEFIIGEAFGIRELTKEDFRDLQNGTKALYWFARVFYDDVFKQRHETSFCGRLHFEPAPGYEKNAEPRPWIVSMMVDQKRSYSD
ncbi:hypothetical protein [Shinella sp. M31]|uniref:hypothetical protein n=1 Tax=Shinella sp. M31 TaxID=3368615 RepID=UPI003B9E1BA4